MADSFSQPAAYWLRRADKQRQAGQPLRAAMLERHAARVEPENDQAQMRYVTALMDLRCYRSSLREAFGALARKPERQALYGPIAQCLTALDQPDEADDALALCRQQGLFLQEDALWEPWQQEPARGRNRLECLLDLACLRLMRGDLSGASACLQRARRFPGASARREEVKAILWEARHQPQLANRAMAHALRLEPENVRLLCSAAGMLARHGHESAALLLLAKAAAYAAVPREWQAVCVTAEMLGEMSLPISMLERAVENEGDLFILYYDLCVCHLRRGELFEAAECIHLCQDMDPDDVPGSFLFQLVEELIRDGYTQPEKVSVRSRVVSWYDLPNPDLLAFFMQPLMEAAASGPKALASLLQEDASMRRLYLFALSAEHDQAEDWLPGLVSVLPPGEAEALLREILLLTTERQLVKRKARELLSAMGAPAPYLLRDQCRLLLDDPAAPARRATFRQRYLTRRISRGAALTADEGFPLWAMEQIHRMSRAQRTGVVADPARIWPMALALRYNALRRHQPVHIPLEELNPIRLKHLVQALQILNSLDTKEAPIHEDH